MTQKHEYIVNSASSAHGFLNDFDELQEKHKYLRVIVYPGRARSVEQNKLAFQCYLDIYWRENIQFPTVSDARAHCKLDLGVPIALEADPEYMDIWFDMIDPYSREKKLKLMVGKIDFPVTRIFGRGDFKQYIEAIERAFPSVPFKHLQDKDLWDKIKH